MLLTACDSWEGAGRLPLRESDERILIMRGLCPHLIPLPGRAGT